MRTGALAWCAAASLAAHAAVLGLAGGGSPLPGPRHGVATVASVQLVPPRPAVTATGAAPSAEALEAQPAAVEPRPASRAAVAMAAPVPLPAAGPAPGGPSPEDALSRLPAVQATGDDFEGYLPRPQLSVPPSLHAPVALTWPEGSGVPDGHYAEVLDLYIDEQGIVRRVEPEGDGMPPALLEAARQSFLAARYEPGQREGRVVKSRIRIRVEYESRPTASSRGP